MNIQYYKAFSLPEKQRKSYFGYDEEYGWVVPSNELEYLKFNELKYKMVQSLKDEITRLRHKMPDFKAIDQNRTIKYLETGEVIEDFKHIYEKESLLFCAINDIKTLISSYGK